MYGKCAYRRIPFNLSWENMKVKKDLTRIVYAVNIIRLLGYKNCIVLSFQIAVIFPLKKDKIFAKIFPSRKNLKGWQPWCAREVQCFHNPYLLQQYIYLYNMIKVYLFMWFFFELGLIPVFFYKKIYVAK